MASFQKDYSFSDFILGEYVHAGGYGTVYSAKRKRDGKEVALKFFGYTKNEPDMTEIRKEVDLMTALEGVEGACQLLGVMKDTAHGHVPNKNPLFRKPYPIMIMELLGQDLFMHLEQRGDISLSYLSHAFRSAMIGLKSIHERKFLHRDMKIDNIVMASHEITSALKIIDFGLMIRVEDVRKGVTTGKVTGTLGYFAPETLLGKHYSAKTDIWQAGCILYTLLAGFPPFHSTEEGNDDIKAGAYYPMDSPEWEVPTPEAKDLVEKMLTLNPEDRIDMDGVLSHPWLSSCEDAVGMGDGYKARIKNLVLRNRLKRHFLCNNVESGLVASSQEAARFYFMEFDRDRTGRIGLNEMIRGIRDMIGTDDDPIAANISEIEQVFRTIDIDNNGTVDFPEFLSFYEALLSATSMSSSRIPSVRLSEAAILGPDTVWRDRESVALTDDPFRGSDEPFCVIS